MNKSLIFGISSIALLIVLAACSFFLLDLFSFTVWIFLAGAVIAIGLGITAFVLSILEIRRNENKPQAIGALVIGSITGILLPLAVVALIIYINSMAWFY